MSWQRIRVRAPHLIGEASDWLNTDSPLTMEQLTREGIVLVDFWDYTCVNCIRTLPYLIEWHERYASLGLTILGIHAPEFAFARQRERVEEAVARFGVSYPVLLDNGLKNWYAFTNRAWPTKYLIDHERIIRFITMGEGRYLQTEEAIQTLLRELHGEALALPSPVEPLRPTDVPGAVCYPTTPELYAGYAHGRLGNPQPFGTDAVQEFQPAAREEEGLLYFEGPWLTTSEYSESAGERCLLHIPYRAAELNVVLASRDNLSRRVFLSQDGAPLGFDDMGEDVVIDIDLGSYVNVSAPRMYNLVINPDFTRHEITLEILTPGVRVYSFTFVSCPRPLDETR